MSNLFKFKSKFLVTLKKFANDLLQDAKRDPRISLEEFLKYQKIVDDLNKLQ